MISVVLLLSGLIALLAISVAAVAQSGPSNDKKQAQAIRNAAPLSIVSTNDPFVLGTWNLAHGGTFSYSPVMTANWRAASKWTVGISCSDTVVRPPGTGGSQTRFVTSFLFLNAKEK